MYDQYPHIFSPLTVGSVTFKNRIFSAPATPHLLQDRQHYPTDEMIAYYAEKARGGTACVCVAGNIIDLMQPDDPGHCDLKITDPLARRHWAKLTEQIHFYGAKASLELLAFNFHGPDADGNPVPLSINGEYGLKLDEQNMRRIAQDHADAAEAALDAGFDSILIHGGHGLFLFRMLSPIFNRRQDDYGGSLENRARFPLMVLDAIRARVGNKLLIEYRISGSELAPKGYHGWEIDDTIAFLKLVRDRIDIAHISVGNMSIRGTEYIMHPSNFSQPGCNAYLAEAVKKADIGLPVLTLGAFQTPDLIEQTLAEGKADIVSIARGTIADPQAPNKAFYGQEDEIIPCIKCFHCLDYGRADRFGCSVNPTVGRELELKLLPPVTTGSKKVVIVGGGPSGMAAAIRATQLGHRVTLFEKADVLGGKLVFSQYADFKYDLHKFLNYQIHMVEKLGIDVRLGVEATPELIAAEQADVVFAAVGADAIVPAIPGVDLPNVLTAEECYGHPERLGQRVVVVGGGEVGCETALYLADLGKDVSVLEMQRYLAPEAMSLPREALLDHLEEACDCYVGCRCTGITAEGVTFRNPYGADQRLLADTVVLSAGMRPRTAQAEQFRRCAPVFRPIGDCVTAKNVRTATRTAFDAASSI
jgi:2,4-dienoyl-CoA reductase-like NADH-dependent reductase (Old Yellow Enzyme family)/thioredoxin reductase